MIALRPPKRPNALRSEADAQARFCWHLHVAVADQVLGRTLYDLDVAGLIGEIRIVSWVMKFAMQAATCNDTAVESALAQLCGATRML